MCNLTWFLLTILFYYASFFFSIIDLYVSIPAVVTQISNPSVEIVIPTGIPIKEAKAEMETQPVNVETKISKCSI